MAPFIFSIHSPTQRNMFNNFVSVDMLIVMWNAVLLLFYEEIIRCQLLLTECSNRAAYCRLNGMIQKNKSVAILSFNALTSILSLSIVFIRTFRNGAEIILGVRGLILARKNGMKLQIRRRTYWIVNARNRRNCFLSEWNWFILFLPFSVSLTRASHTSPLDRLHAKGEHWTEYQECDWSRWRYCTSVITFNVFI